MLMFPPIFEPENIDIPRVSCHYIGMSNTTHERAKAKVQELILKAETAYKRPFPIPAIDYNLRGRVAGRACYSKWKIKLNRFLIESDTEQIINQTLPHEIAHLITFARNPRASAHGFEWRMVMMLFGVPADRCHHMDTTNAGRNKSTKQRRWTYSCKCREHKITTVRHRRALRRMASIGRTGYHCKYCKVNIVLKGSVPKTTAQIRALNEKEWQDGPKVKFPPVRKRPGTKFDLAFTIYRTTLDLGRDAVLNRMIAEMSITRGNATTYFNRCQKAA